MVVEMCLVGGHGSGEVFPATCHSEAMAEASPFMDRISFLLYSVPKASKRALTCFSPAAPGLGGELVLGAF